MPPDIHMPKREGHPYIQSTELAESTHLNLYRFLSVSAASSIQSNPFELPLFLQIIIDDWSIAHCRQAVLDFRSWFGITEEVVPLPDGVGAWWTKLRDVEIDMSNYYASPNYKGTPPPGIR